MGSSTVCRKPRTMVSIPDHFKSLEVCERAVKHDLSFLQFVPDWFETLQQIDIWHRNDDYCNDNVIIGMMIKTKFLTDMMGVKNARLKKYKLKKS